MLISMLPGPSPPLSPCYNIMQISAGKIRCLSTFRMALSPEGSVCPVENKSTINRGLKNVLSEGKNNECLNNTQYICTQKKAGVKVAWLALPLMWVVFLVDEPWLQNEILTTKVIKRAAIHAAWTILAFDQGQHSKQDLRSSQCLHK